MAAFVIEAIAEATVAAVAATVTSAIQAAARRERPMAIATRQAGSAADGATLYLFALPAASMLCR